MPVVHNLNTAGICFDDDLPIDNLDFDHLNHFFFGTNDCIYEANFDFGP